MEIKSGSIVVERNQFTTHKIMHVARTLDELWCQIGVHVMLLMFFCRCRMHVVKGGASALPVYPLMSSLWFLKSVAVMLLLLFPAHCITPRGWAAFHSVISYDRSITPHMSSLTDWVLWETQPYKCSNGAHSHVHTVTHCVYYMAYMYCVI